MEYKLVKKAHDSPISCLINKQSYEIDWRTSDIQKYEHYLGLFKNVQPSSDVDNELEYILQDEYDEF